MTSPDHTDEEGPGLLSWPFWLGGAASIAVWTGLWWLIAAALDRIN